MFTFNPDGTCDVGVIAHSTEFLQLLCMRWARWEWGDPQWDYRWVDPLAQCNSEAEYDTDIQEDDAAHGPAVDDLSGMW